jgi:cyclopropane-fatty-acyl-phospholipid synthase
MMEISECGISGAKDFHSLWMLPGLPLTERFGPYDPNHKLAFDQELIISMPTGHVQLRSQLDPKILYGSSEYSFRTGGSDKSRKGVDFFLAYLQQFTLGRSFKSAVDVGGNDLFVVRGLTGTARHCSVVDPICAPIDGQTIEGIKVFGRFVEEVDFSSDMPPPDLVVCRHTLEHITNPRQVIDQWFRQCEEDCLYVVEVPCFENLVESLRFDAVFHQHVHYFDLSSFKHLIWECGGEYLWHTFNPQGSCGGSLLVAFRRAMTKQVKPEIELASRIAGFERRIALYKTQMAVMKELLDVLPGPVYGYGASLMLATLGYHLQTDFSKLECVLDDDASRDGATYENIPVTVRHTAKVAPAPNSSYLITSLENIRPIYRRILELTPRRILVPPVS